MSVVECECPFCPLKAKKLNICDVHYTIRKENYDVSFPKERKSEFDDCVEKNLLKVVFISRYKYEVRKKGQTIRWPEDDFECVVECLGRNKYKVCFHTK